MPDIRWEWINRHSDDIMRATWEHLLLVVTSVAIAIAVAVPLATLVRNSRVGRALVGGGTAAVYTIPSIALFAILVTITGIGRTPAIIGLTGYALVMLVRSTLAGLDAVPTAVLEAARGMGMNGRQLLQRVELPLAVPAILTGIRLATLETVAIETIAVFVAGGGLGDLIYSAGISRDLFLTPIAAGTAMAIALALALDGLLFTVLRVTTRWQRAGGAQ